MDSMRLRGVAVFCAVLAAAALLAPGVRAPPLPPFDLFGHALDAGGAPLPVGTGLQAFIDGVSYPIAPMVTAPDGSYAMSVLGNSYIGSASDTPEIKEGADPGDLVVFTVGDLTTGGAVFREAGSWQPGSAVALDLRVANTSKQPALLKIQTVVTRPADAGTQYAYVCNPVSGTEVDLSRYYLQKDVGGSVNGPTVPLSGLVSPGTRMYADLGSRSFLVPTGDALKLVWRNPGGSDSPAAGADIVIDRVEFNATSGGTLSWEPGNTILSDAAAAGVGQELRRVPQCTDTNAGSDFQVGPEGGRPLPPRGFVWTDYLWIALVAAAVVVVAVILIYGRRKGRAPRQEAPLGRVSMPPAAPPGGLPPQPPPAQPLPESRAAGGQKECPACHTIVRADDAACFYCGHVF